MLSVGGAFVELAGHPPVSIITPALINVDPLRAYWWPPRFFFALRLRHHSVQWLAQDGSDFLLPRFPYFFLIQ